MASTHFLRPSLLQPPSVPANLVGDDEDDSWRKGAGDRAASIPARRGLPSGGGGVQEEAHCALGPQEQRQVGRGGVHRVRLHPSPFSFSSLSPSLLPLLSSLPGRHLFLH